MNTGELSESIHLVEMFPRTACDLNLFAFSVATLLLSVPLVARPQ